MGPNEQPVPQPQPQPVPAPVLQPQPVPQPQSVPVQFGGPNNSSPIPVSPMPKDNKLIIIVSSVIFALFVAVVVAVALMSGVTKDDYSKSSEVVDDIATSYSMMGSLYLGTGSDLSDIKRDVDSLKSERLKFNTDLKTLGETKAIKNDSEMNKLYKAITSRKVAFDSAHDATIEAYEKIAPAVAESTIDYSDDGEAVFSSIKSKLQDISGLKDYDNQKLVEDLITKLDELETLYAKIAAGQTDYRKYDANATTDYYDASTEYSEIILDWQTTLRDRMSAGELTDQINDLGNALTDKENE